MIVNGKVLTIPEVTYGTIPKLERLGVTLSDFTTKPFLFVAAMLSIALNEDIETAYEDLDAYVKAGGNVVEIMGEVKKAIDESGFIKALVSAQAATTGAETGTVKPRTRTTK